MAALEETFGAPVIESYGMTEASHQMTSNPLPPRRRKPSSVGVAAGPEVAIMSEDGRILPSGEIVIRGLNVTRGYEANPEANAKAFTDGWFRTGDQGVIDEDGYVRITGRLKELINRGGEKVEPARSRRGAHGPSGGAAGRDLRLAAPDARGRGRFGRRPARERAPHGARVARFREGPLAEFKVPRKVVFVEEIPKGATGKLQPIELADKLGLGAAAE